jgi:hypothetical protein
VSEKPGPVYVFKVQTPKRAATIRLQGPFFVLGRGEPYPVFHDDPTLSREHLAVVDTPKGYLVKDLGSRNGVLLNGRRLERYGEAPFEPGDVVIAGNTKVRLLLQVEAEAEAKAEAEARAAGEEPAAAMTVEADGSSSGIPAMAVPALEEDLEGEVTGALDRPADLEDPDEVEQDPEATQIALDDGDLEGDLDAPFDPDATQIALDDDDPAGDLEAAFDPDATQIALDDDPGDVGAGPPAEDSLGRDPREPALPDRGDVDALAAEIDAASERATASPATEDGSEPLASRSDLQRLADDLGVDPDDLEADLESAHDELVDEDEEDPEPEVELA